MKEPDSDLTWETEDDTHAFAYSLSPILRPGDTILLEGEIGAGKSFLARAIIRARCGEETEVPSPTFTLVQSYDDDQAEIWHADLYRLSGPDEAVELGLTDAFESAICLIEWPDRLGVYRPKDALTIHLEATAAGHVAQFTGTQQWLERLKGMLSDA